MIDSTTGKIINKIIKSGKPVVILTHRNPDGDAIGSSTALGLYLKKRNVKVDIIIPNDVPAFLKWLPGCELVTVYKHAKAKSKELVVNAGALFFLDFNDPERVVELKEEIAASTADKILIDHHQNPASFADIAISETWRGSVGEMIYELIVDLGDKDLMDNDIATSLYVAIITDTGNFRYSSSYPGIFHIVGELMHYGIEKDKIFTNVYDSYSENRMKLMGYCMLEKMVIHEKYGAAYISITQEELNRFGHQIGDTEGFVNIPFSIDGIKFTALFIEKPGHVKISFRSKGTFPVNVFAESHFSGGGHVNAAGGQENGSLSDTINKFESLLPQYEDKLSDK